MTGIVNVDPVRDCRGREIGSRVPGAALMAASPELLDMPLPVESVQHPGQDQPSRGRSAIPVGSVEIYLNYPFISPIAVHQAPGCLVFQIA
jgi:hypothetical protein